MKQEKTENWVLIILAIIANTTIVAIVGIFVNILTSRTIILNSSIILAVISLLLAGIGIIIAVFNSKGSSLNPSSEKNGQKETSELTELQKEKLEELEIEKRQNEIAYEKLELDKVRLEIQQKQFNFALETVNKIISTLQPDIDQETKTKLVTTLLPQILSLSGSEETKIDLTTQNIEAS